ncbi:copper resistance CopC/CopD family protein [Streptomyces uncialis]|uniref:copper resistance CopC/CopD family protein n=1 Tax=Streptomyces uncialis TaxID=1048205 RepID=UPI00386A52FC|nr:copper resistance protein CopC [Streptomyces uncialis]
MLTVVPRFRSLLLLFLLATGAVLTGAPPASAHAALTGSVPERGSVVVTAPEQVSITFSEKVALADNSLRVLDPKGERVDTGPTSEQGEAGYSVALKPELPDGTFTVTYQVVSADSHPVSGAFTFSVGAPSETTVSVQDQDSGGAVGALYDLGRYVSYAGFVLVVGGAAFVLVCWPRGAGVRAVQRVVVSGWLALTAATLSLLLIRGPYTGSGKLADIFDLGLLGGVLQTRTGAALISRLLLLAAAALFIAVLFGAYARAVAERDAAGPEPSGSDPTTSGPELSKPASGGTKRTGAKPVAKSAGTKATGAKPVGTGAVGTKANGTGAVATEANGTGAVATEGADAGVSQRDLAFGLRVGGFVVAAGIAATWALSEHASTGIQTGLAMPLDVVHLLTVATWIGGLTTLLIALYRAPSLETAAVERFSRIAFGCVVVLAVTGLYQSWRQVGSWSGLTGTDYGRLLMTKIALIAVVIGIAWFSRRWVARLTQRPTDLSTDLSTDLPTGPSADPGADQDGSRTPDGRGSGTRAGSTADSTDSTDSPDGTDSAVGTAPEPDTARAAQLARQRTAVATARVKRTRDADPLRSGLRRSVFAEVAVAVVLLGVTTLLTATEPARTQESAERAARTAGAPAGPLSVRLPFDTGGQDGKGVATVDLEPGRTGNNALHLYVERPNGSGFDVPEVQVAFTLKAKDIGPLPVTPDRVATAHWTAAGVQLPMAGDWEIAVTVRTSDIDQVTVKKTTRIG